MRARRAVKGAPLVAALLVAGTLLAGCGAPPGPALPAEWQGRDLRKPGWQNVTIESGWSLAVEYAPWPAGTRVAWDWFTTPDQYLYFQLVRDTGSGPVKVFARHATQEAGSATISQPGAHQFVWVNDFIGPITLTVLVPEGGRNIAYPPGEGPGCLLLNGGFC